MHFHLLSLVQTKGTKQPQCVLKALYLWLKPIRKWAFFLATENTSAKGETGRKSPVGSTKLMVISPLTMPSRRLSPTTSEFSACWETTATRNPEAGRPLLPVAVMKFSVPPSC